MESVGIGFDADRLERRWPSAIAAATFPLAYFGVSFVGALIRGIPLRQSPTHLAITLLALGLLGALTVDGWQRGLRLFPLIAWIGAVPWNWLYAGKSLGSAMLTFIFVGIVLFVGGAEWSVRFRGRVGVLLKTREVRVAVGAGVVHLVVGLALQSVAWNGIEFIGLGPVTQFLLVLSGLALLTMGTLPLLLWYRWRLVTPLMWVVWQLSLALTWLMLSGEVPGMHATAWVSPFLYPNYLLNWGLPFLVLLLLAGAEYGTRNLWAQFCDVR